MENYELPSEYLVRVGDNPNRAGRLGGLAYRFTRLAGERPVRKKIRGRLCEFYTTSALDAAYEALTGGHDNDVFYIARKAGIVPLRGYLPQVDT